jgi:enterochelin esterase-like enzyme
MLGMPRNRILVARSMALATLFSSLCLAQKPRPDREDVPGAAGIELKPSRPDAPEGFDVVKPGVARGEVVSFEYASKGGDIYRAKLHLPPGYDGSRKYPVLYLLHGANGDENDWLREMRADVILDNLYVEQRLVPMLVVMPSSLSVAARAEAGDNREAKIRAGMTFGRGLVQDLIPWVETRYLVLAGREHRALAGVSMGGAIALATGLANADQFAWVGAFSGAGRRWTEPAEKLNLLWLSVGHQDTMAGNGMSAASAFFAEKNVPHEFHIGTGAHEPKVWRNDLYHFVPLLFREK